MSHKLKGKYQDIDYNVFRIFNLKINYVANKLFAEIQLSEIALSHSISLKCIKILLIFKVNLEIIDEL